MYVYVGCNICCLFMYISVTVVRYMYVYILDNNNTLLSIFRSIYVCRADSFLRVARHTHKISNQGHGSTLVWLEWVLGHGSGASCEMPFKNSQRMFCSGTIAKRYIVLYVCIYIVYLQCILRILVCLGALNGRLNTQVCRMVSMLQSFQGSMGTHSYM